MIEFTREKFTEWLKTFDPHTRVGQCTHPESCVIAEFLMDQGAKHVTVWPARDLDEARAIINGDCVPLPKWANDLAMAYDEKGFTSTAAEIQRMLAYV